MEKIIDLKDKQGNKLFLNMHPIGSIYMSVNPTNPKEFFGGKWELWGKGRTPVCIDPSQEEFKNVEQLGGEKEHTLTIDELPKSTVVNGAGNIHVTTTGNNTIKSLSKEPKPHNNMQPYITCYMWKRIA